MSYNPQTEMLRRMEHADFAYRIGDKETLPEWQTRARARLLERLGLPLEKVAPETRIEWTREEDGYTETRFVFKSEKDVFVPCHLLLPSNSSGGKLPLVICLQGHSTGMHISLGRPVYPGDAESIAGDRDFARQAVRRGQAALAIEQRGFGECGGTRVSRIYADADGNLKCEWIQNIGGSAFTGETWIQIDMDYLVD